MCGNTRPKLLEVSYGKTSQHKKSLYSYRVKYRTHHCVFQTLGYQPTHSRHPLEQPRGTTTETDEDGDRWRRRRCTKTDALWGRAKWQLPFSWRLPQSNADGGRRRRQTHSGIERSGSSLTADDTPEWRRLNLIPHLPCDSLTPKPMTDAAVSAAPGPVVEPSQ